LKIRKKEKEWRLDYFPMHLWIGIHSLLKLIFTRWSADVICFILRLLRHCGLCTDMDHKLGHAQNI